MLFPCILNLFGLSQRTPLIVDVLDECHENRRSELIEALDRLQVESPQDFDFEQAE
jgi:hypothetical protein